MQGTNSVMNTMLTEILKTKSGLPERHKRVRNAPDLIKSEPMSWDDILEVCSLWNRCMSTYQAAEAAGVNPATVRNLSKGNTVNSANMQAIADAFDVKLAAMYVLRENMDVELKSELFLTIQNAD